MQTVCIQSWYDRRLEWKPNDYGGVARLYVKPTDIWLPDIVLYNRCVSIDSALLEWVSEYAVQAAYSTPDSAGILLNPRSDRIN